MQGVRRDFMDMPECAVQKLFVMRCQMHVWRNLVYSQPRNIFVKRDVKLTEPPDAEPHVRWCERSAAKAVSYSIKPAPLYQGGKYLLCGRRHLSQHVVCTPSVPDRWEFWLCSCSCRDAYPEQERAFPVASGTSGWVERRKSPGNEGTGWHHSWFWMERGQDTQGSPLFFPWVESNAGMQWNFENSIFKTWWDREYDFWLIWPEGLEIIDSGK